jgi:hypothetical protein
LLGEQRKFRRRTGAAQAGRHHHHNQVAEPVARITSDSSPAAHGNPECGEDTQKESSMRRRDQSNAATGAKTATFSMQLGITYPTTAVNPG